MAYLPATTVGKQLISAASAAAGRTALELGTMAEQDADAVAITGGTIEGVTISDLQTVTLVNASSELLNEDSEVVIVTYNSSDCTVTLPPATSGLVGKVITIKRSPSATSYNTIIAADATGTPDTIDGSSTYTLLTAGESISLICPAVNQWAIF